MSETRVVDLPDLDNVTDEPEVMHSYPRDPRYRRSGSIPVPQPGDIAFCGHIKTTPGHAANIGRPVTCVRCARLSRMGLL